MTKDRILLYNHGRDDKEKEGMYPFKLFGNITLYEIFLTIGILAAFFLADKMAVKSGFSIRLQRFFVIAIPLTILIGFGGAVLFQAFYNFMETGVFTVDQGTGMTFYGGLVFGVFAFLLIWFLGGKIFVKEGETVKKFGAVADIAACVIPLAHGFGRLGCFFAGCCHGKTTDAWYGVNMLTESGWQKVVPVQLFEALVLFLLSAVLFWLFFAQHKQSEEKKMQRFPLLPIYAVVYGIWRFFIEYARGDDRGETIVSFLSPSQLIALVLIAAGVAYFCIWFFSKDKNKINI